MSFSEGFVAKRLQSRCRFYEQVDFLVDWGRIERLIREYYAPGRTVAGRKAYSELLSFKMLLIGI